MYREGSEPVRFISFQPGENETFQILKNFKYKNVKLMMIFNVTIQKVFLINVFEKSHQGCIYLIKSTVKTEILWNIITI